MNGNLWTYPEGFGRVDVTGYDVEAVDGDIGTVDETSLDVDAGYLVVDTGRWIFGKKVLIPAGLIERVDRDEETVYLARAKDEIERAPEFDQEQSTDPAYREQLSAYYAAGRAEPEQDETVRGSAQGEEGVTG